MNSVLGQREEKKCEKEEQTKKVKVGKEDTKNK
jgi:hypothetical protein